MKRVISKAAAILFALVLVLSANVFCFADMLSAAALSVEMKTGTNATQGENFAMTFEVKANGTAVSYTSAELNFSNAAGLTISGGSTGSVTLQSGDISSLNFTLAVNRFAETGKRDFTLLLKNGSETVYESQMLFVNINEKKYIRGGDTSYTGTVEIDASPSPSEGFETGEGNSLSFNLYNASNKNLKGVKATLTMPEGVVIGNNGSNEVTIGNMKLGESANISFPLIVEKGLYKKTYTFTLAVTGIIKGSDGDTPMPDTSKAFYIYINGTKELDEEDDEDEEDDDDDKSTPQLMVSGYSYGGDAVYAGDTFNLGMTFLNTSEKTLKNIKVTISAGDSFVPVGSSSSFYISEIKAGATYSKSLKMACDHEAVQKMTPVTINTTYEDKDGGNYSASDVISIPVKQDTKLVVEDVTPPYEAYMGNECYLSVNYYNMGKTQLSNLKITAEGDFDTYQSLTEFVGTFAVGASSDYSFTVIPRQVGACSGKVIFTYDDTEGKTQTIETPFTFEVIEMPVWDDPSMDMPVEEEQGTPKSLIICGIVVALLIAAFIVWRVLRKKKMNRSLEIDDEE